ncbi:GNAT family N-acetyltransferase [Bacillus sp. MUM 116]|uniref:GNAT family N-acetyltransferase n=1 Tax=Bacillus sp. MUM 116 TaxID=1678002 RepID=UPI0008F563A2|nr:GNAT family N-acetyltransferase [Bacillus sp. MUM 116]OIK10783.1 GNAT family N-acetyltransferase [Bacillus sp. MUM 116]
MERTFEILKKTPTLEEFTNLCSVVGLGDNINFNVAEISLENSVHAVLVKDNDKVIGMGRIVGDGAIYFFIQDVIVHPSYRGMGLGIEIMNSLIEYLENNAPNKAIMGLFISKGKGTFYDKYNFEDVTPNMKGVYTVIKKCE